MAEEDNVGTAERYEFDAPSHVVDLRELLDVDCDDKWFEQQATGADGHLITPLRSDLPFTRSDTPELPRTIITQVKTDVNTEPGTSFDAEIVTQTDPQPRSRATNLPPARPRRVSKRKGTNSGSAETPLAAPPSKKHKTTPTAQRAQKILTRRRRSGQLTPRATRSQAAAAAASNNSDSEWLTVEEEELKCNRNVQEEDALALYPPEPGTSTYPPSNIVTSWGGESITQTDAQPRSRATNLPPARPRRTPTAQRAQKILTRRRRSGQLTPRATRSQAAAASNNSASERLTSEEQELERMRNLQKKVALHRKKNEASYKAALAGYPPPKKTALSITVPNEFIFNTDSRIKSTTSSKKANKEVDFISQLRKPSLPVKAKRGPTIPEPFNLSKGSKRKMEGPNDYGDCAEGPSKVRDDHLKLTVPHSPHLITKQRSRPPTVKSSADLEAEEVDRLNKFKFKALELNKNILESAEELKKPVVKESTVPEVFELQIEKRLQERQASKKTQEGEERPHTFKSRPLPKKILDGVVGVPEKRVLLPTVPESPAFALKKRVRVDTKVEAVKQPSPVKPTPVPYFGLPFQPRLPEKHHLEVCPFSFEERERERRALKEKRMEEKQNEEVPQFKAQPLPDFDTVTLPEKKRLEPTKPEPFRLLLDERGAVRSSHWEQMVKEEQKRQEEAATFKARPSTVTYKEPFQPKREDRATIVVEAFELSTERRARERQEYERQASEREALRAVMEEEQRREEEQREIEEISRLRQEQVHKAQPIRHYKPVAVKKSEAPLTIPKSPNFSDRFRL